MNQRLITAEDAHALAEARGAVQPTHQEKASEAARIAATLAAQIEAHRARVQQAEAALQHEQEALAQITRQLEAAQAAREQRQRKITEFEQQAARAAQEHIAAGRAEVSQAEQDADDQAERLRREVARADAALATLRAQHAEAARTVEAASKAVQQARVDLEKVQAEQAVGQLHAKIRALVEELRQTTEAGRAHNRAVIELMQRWALVNGRSQMTDLSARAAGAALLFLPGTLPGIQPDDNETISAYGFALRFTRDLAISDVDESLVRRR